MTGTLKTAEYFYLGIRQISNCCLQIQNMINVVDFVLLFATSGILLIAAIIVRKVSAYMHDP
jgi:hypothetical protein